MFLKNRQKEIDFKNSIKIELFLPIVQICLKKSLDVSKAGELNTAYY